MCELYGPYQAPDCSIHARGAIGESQEALRPCWPSSRANSNDLAVCLALPANSFVIRTVSASRRISRLCLARELNFPAVKHELDEF